MDDQHAIASTSIGSRNETPKIDSDELISEKIESDKSLCATSSSSDESKSTSENSKSSEPQKPHANDDGDNTTADDEEDDKQTINSNRSSGATASSMIDDSDRTICEEKLAAVKVNGDLAAIKTPKILSGKPKSFSIKCENSIAAAKATKTVRARRKREALASTCTYQSQITDDHVGIKLKLKKSATPVKESTGRKRNSAGTTATPPGKGHRKRSRKSKHNDSDSDDSDYERRRNNNTTGEKVRSRKTTKQSESVDEPEEQSGWGSIIPEHILLEIFDYAVGQDGCLPTVVNAGKVCSLWQRISLTPKLWRTVDLSTWVKDRNELILKWIIENRLPVNCVEVNLGKWLTKNDSVFIY